MTGHRVVVWGDVIDDIVVRPFGKVRPDTDTQAEIRSRPGGSAANVAAWLGRSGVLVDFVGRVGADDVARHEAELAALGVTPHLIADAELPTGTIVVIVDEENGRTMLTQRGANRALRPADIADSLLEGAVLTHFTGYSVFNGDHAPETTRAGLDAEFRAFFERSAAAGTAVSVDPGSAGFLRDYGPERFLETIRGTTILLPNSDEARVLAGSDDDLEAAGILARRFPVVVVTMGARGTIVATSGAEPLVVPVEAIDRADTTGAGDAFAAGFLAAWLETPDAVLAAQRAASLAAESLTRVGGRPTQPS